MEAPDGFIPEAILLSWLKGPDSFRALYCDLMQNRRETFMADNSSYHADIAKYVSSVDPAIVDSIVKYCGIALRSKDASLVSCTDPEELGRVRDGFASKKLGLSGDAADKAMAAVCDKMKGDRTKSRVTFYYLLAEETGTTDALA